MTKQEIDILVARCNIYEATLMEIRSNYGHVCENFELCEHAACRDSYSAWATADKALKESRGLRYS